MLNRRGTSTNIAYITSAGRTNNQPMMFSRRRKVIHREKAEAVGRLSDVIIVTVNLAGAGIAPRPSPLLREFCFVFCLNGL